MNKIIIFAALLISLFSCKRVVTVEIEPYQVSPTAACAEMLHAICEHTVLCIKNENADYTLKVCESELLHTCADFPAKEVHETILYEECLIDIGEMNCDGEDIPSSCLAMYEERD